MAHEEHPQIAETRNKIRAMSMGELVKPHAIRIIAVFSGVIISVLLLSIVYSFFYDSFEAFLLFMMSAFPPPYEIIGFVVGIVLFCLLLFFLQLVFTWSVTHFILVKYKEDIIRTPIQNRIARLMKYFGVGVFLIIILATFGSPILNIDFGSDIATAVFFSVTLLIIILYLGSTVGQLVTDALFYYYYKTER